MVTFDKLGYLTTRELYVLMSELGIPYCNIEDTEKENLETGEMVTVPKFIPRTDYDKMKSDIIVALNGLNRERRRFYSAKVDKIAKPRMRKVRDGANG